MTNFSKNITMVLFLCFFSSGTSLYAQEMNKAEKVDVARSIIRSESEREAIVSSTMEISKEEREKFWALYKAYRQEMRKVNERAVNLITEYLEHYGNHSDEKARAMLDEFLKIKKAELSVKEMYIKKFSNVMAPTRTLKLFQVENRLDAVVMNQLINQIPLVQ